MVNKKSVKKSRFCPFCLFATFFGAGKIKGCPGTWGSLATIPFWLLVNLTLIKTTQEFVVFWIVVIPLMLIVGTKASNIYLHKKGNGKTDPSEIVIDEVVGQLISLFMGMSYYAYIVTVSNKFIVGDFSRLTLVGLVLIVPFIAFRFFDILKPWIVGDIDKNVKGGLGIMLDDVAAGIFGGLATILVVFLCYIFNVL